MPTSKTHDATPPNAKAVIEAEASIDARRDALRTERDARISAALARLRYGNEMGGAAGYHWSGGLLRLR